MIDSAATTDADQPECPLLLASWTSRAEIGAHFDLAGEDPLHLGEITRARFDGASLRLEHWAQGGLVAEVELRREKSGEWRARAIPNGVIGQVPAETMQIACEDLEHAFAVARPDVPLDWVHRLVGVAPWASMRRRFR